MNNGKYDISGCNPKRNTKGDTLQKLGCCGGNECTKTGSITEPFKAQDDKYNSLTYDEIDSIIRKDFVRKIMDYFDISDTILNIKRIKPFVLITEKGTITKTIELLSIEIKILEKAVFDNNSIVNFLSNIEEIKDLFNKGLLHISKDGGFIVTNRLVDVILNTCKTMGSLLFYEGGGLTKEIRKDCRYNDGVEVVTWCLAGV